MERLVINNEILDQPYDGVKARKVVNTDAVEILSISMSKDALLPAHKSARDAHLVVITGEIIFKMEGVALQLKGQQELSFKKDVEHWVEAKTNSKFLIIR